MLVWLEQFYSTTQRSDLFQFFINTQNWQYWHYCQLCITMYLQLRSFFAPCDISKCEIRCQWVYEDYISGLKTSLVSFISNGTAKTKLPILAFLCCGEFMKTSVVRPSNYFSPLVSNLFTRSASYFGQSVLHPVIDPSNRISSFRSTWIFLTTASTKS